MLEKRKKDSGVKTGLPAEYLKLLEQTVADFFKNWVAAQDFDVRFYATGAIFPDEILLGVSVQPTDPKVGISGVAVHLSCDFKPAENVHAILEGCLDVLAHGFDSLLADGKTSQDSVFEANLDELAENYKVPVVWKNMENIAKQKVFLRVDKTNFMLEDLANSLLGSEV
jgi:hypothetical protein